MVFTNQVRSEFRFKFRVALAAVMIRDLGKCVCVIIKLLNKNRRYKV